MLPELIAGVEMPRSGPLVDRFGRTHTYLRVSVTDRCNYRCTYCTPSAGFVPMSGDAILSYEEIARIVRVVARSGVRSVRLSGGEPTVRRDIVALVRQIASVDGITDVSMTTNAHLLAPMAHPLAAAGLRRVNVSLDTLDPVQFRRLTHTGDLPCVLAGIDAAISAGLVPVKLNAVIIGGENEDQVMALIERFAPLASAVQVRFIEYMRFAGGPEGETVASPRAGWRHVPAASLRDRIATRWAFDPIDARPHGGPATHVRLRDSGLVVGFIAPMTEHFCQSCNRLRVQADGHLRTCLSRDAAPSLRDLLRAGVDDDALEFQIRRRLWDKIAGHQAHVLPDPGFQGMMMAIGG